MGKIKTEKGKSVVPPTTVAHGCARRSTFVAVLRAPPRLTSKLLRHHSRSTAKPRSATVIFLPRLRARPLSRDPSHEQRRPRTRHLATPPRQSPWPPLFSLPSFEWD
ncbi:RHS repeat-associated protein [Sesbania bispinosa]|nr:RHS repeat-associated protein [Sesbania bispinosa]